MEYALVVLWWVTYVGLGLFGLPVAAQLCSSLPGHGAGFSLTIALTIVTLVAFWVGFLALGWVALFAGLVALAICAVLAIRADVDINRRAAAESFVVFTLIYLAAIIVRVVDPGITPHGEKFLDFGLMVSLYRAPSLPLEDFWFSGKSVIYYYGGHFLASLLTRLTNTHPWYGFNLSIAGFYAMLAAGVYELAGAIAVGRRCRDNFTSTWSIKNNHIRLFAGAMAVFFTVFASNLSMAVRLFVRRLPAAIRDDAVQAFASVHSELPVYQVFKPIPLDYQFKVAGRIMPKLYNPFPLFAIIRGDMRPYLLSIPFLIVVIGLCYAFYRAPVTAVRRQRALIFGAIPIVAGFMAIVNTWGFVVVLGFMWLTLSFSPTHLRSLLPERSPVDVDSLIRRLAINMTGNTLVRTIGALGIAAIVGIVGVVVALPFFLGPISSAPSSPLVTVAAEARSSLGALLLIHGAFLVVFVVYYLGRIRSRWTSGAAIAGLLLFVASVMLVPRTLASIMLFAPLLAIGWYFLATERTGFEGILIVAGFGLVLFAELVYVKEGGMGRFNTVVKTYMPTWIFWATATGVVLPRLIRGSGEWSWSCRQQIGSVFVVLLIITTAAFGGIALGSHFTEPGEPNIENPTLDGMAAAERNIPGQVEAIQWLYNHSGRPNMISAPAWRVYRWSASPAASLTGIPTVVGVSHEAQYRGRRTFEKRVRAVNTIYLGSDEQRATLLKRYNVRYIYVGPTERIRYGDIRPFSTLRGVSVAFQAGNVTIYEVHSDSYGSDQSKYEQFSD
jgi:YYY domain-containing protein